MPLRQPSTNASFEQAVPVETAAPLTVYRERHAPIIVADPENRDEWLVARKTGIGSSDAAAAIGLDPYRAPLTVYREKRGEIEPVAENRQMLFGTLFEPSIISGWQLQTGKVAQHPMPLCRHPDYPFMLATPDGAIDSTRGIEVKATSPEIAMRIETEGLPNVWPQHIVQAHQQMAVMGWEAVTLVVFWSISTAKWEIIECEVPRNDLLIDRMVDREGELWDRIVRGDPPALEPDHMRIGRVIREVFPRVATGNVVTLSEESVAAWQRLRERKSLIKQLKEENERDRAVALIEIGENLGGLLPDGMMVKRIRIAPSTYTVNRKESIKVREVKAQHISAAALMVEYDQPADPDPALKLLTDIEAILVDAGFVGYDTDQLDTKYYVHLTRNDVGRVRVSTREASKVQQEQMRINGDMAILIDDAISLSDVSDRIKQMVGR